MLKIRWPLLRWPLLLLILVVSCAVPPAVPSTPTPFQPSGPTSTPFQPIGPTAAPTPTPTAASPYQFHGLDFSAAGSTYNVLLQPGAEINGGRALAVTLRPGWPCNYEDHRACISLHLDGRLILATVHSGVGGEGDGLRDALEGSGLNRAGLPLVTVQQNLTALQGAPVSVEGGELDGARVLAAARVPAALVDSYYRLPVDEALALIAGFDPALETALASGRPLLAIETCGWRHPEEPWAAGVTDTTGAVYLIVIG